MPNRQFAIAAVQAAPVFLDKHATTRKAIDLIAEAGAQGVKVIAFPETWISGYPYWIWLGAPAWGMQFVQRYYDNSPVAEGPEEHDLRDAARRHGMTVIMGLSERIGSSLYMAQWIIGPDGEMIARRRKLKPTHVERTVFGEGDGSDLAVHETEFGKIGALCCWEHLQPLTKYAMYAQGEQIHVAAWPALSLYRGGAYALGPEVNAGAASQTYAVEGQCFVLASCGVVSPEMIEMLCDGEDKRQMLQAGGGFSRIYGPDGSPLGENLSETEEGLVIAEIDLGMISLAKAAADPAGHYSRPDVTRLLINRRAARPVVEFGEDAEGGIADPAFDAEDVPEAAQ